MKRLLKTGLIAACAIGLTTTASQAGDRHRHGHSSCQKKNTVSQILRIASEVSRAVHHSKYHSSRGSSCSSSRGSHYAPPRGYSSYRRSPGVTIRFSSGPSYRSSSCRSSSRYSSHRGHRH